MSKKSQTNLLEYELQYDYVMVQPVDVDQVSGLVRPDQYDDKPEFGTVVKVGPGRMLEDGAIVPLRVKEGDTIYFGKYSSIQIRSEGVDFFIIRDDDVMAIRSNAKSKKTV